MHLLLSWIVIELLFILVILGGTWHYRNSPFVKEIVTFRGHFDIFHRIVITASITYLILISLVVQQHCLIILICHWGSMSSSTYHVFGLVVCIDIAPCITCWAVESLILLLFNLQLNYILWLLVTQMRVLLGALWFLLVDEGLHVLFDVLLYVVMRTRYFGLLWIIAFQRNALLLVVEWWLNFLSVSSQSHVSVNRSKVWLVRELISERGSIIRIIMNWDVQVVHFRVFHRDLALCLVVVLNCAKRWWSNIAICKVCSGTLRQATRAEELKIFQESLVEHIFWHLLHHVRILLHKLLLVLHL